MRRAGDYGVAGGGSRLAGTTTEAGTPCALASPEIMSESSSAPAAVTLGAIFRTFLFIGATSFGGGVVAYLRENLVTTRRWLDDEEFLSALEISQTLPGLNATNMSIIVGDRMRGMAGAIAAFMGMALPGTLVIFVLGVLYGQHGENPIVSAMLDGVGAAATGLLLAVTLQIGRKELAGIADLVLVAATCVAVSVFRLPLLVVLLTIGPLAVWWYRPRRAAEPRAE
jgi:chromate transporter